MPIQNQDQVFDSNDLPINVGTRVKVEYKFKASGATEYVDRVDYGTVTKITDPDGDVDDEGRSIVIPPYVHVKFDDGDYDCYPCYQPYDYYLEGNGNCVCGDVDVVTSP